MADKTIKKNTIETLEDLELAMRELREAQKIFSTYTQEQVDAIFKAAATAANKARIPLSRMAVEETGMGVLEDKVIKNHYAAEYIYNAYKNTKTCGVIEYYFIKCMSNHEKGIWVRIPSELFTVIRE